MDNSATTRPFDAVTDTVLRYMKEDYYNPSALYAEGVRLATVLKDARSQWAGYLGCKTEEIIFTSGGTESNNLAIMGLVHKLKRKIKIVISASEHSSVYQWASYLEQKSHPVTYVPHDEKGRVDEDAFSEAMEQDVDLVSIMQVNNETGAVNDIARLCAIAKNIAPNCFFHSDGVQACCKLASPIPSGIDAYSVSAHKFHGPRGVGLLYVKSGSNLASSMLGGGQESGMRSGTENMAGIMGMTTAMQQYNSEHEPIITRMKAIKSRLWDNLQGLENSRLNGGDIASAAPHILSIGFAGVQAETLLHALEQNDILVATGSACASHKKGKNRVLQASHVPDEYASGTLRFSFGYYNTIEQADIVSEQLIQQVRRLRRFVKR